MRELFLICQVYLSYLTILHTHMTLHSFYIYSMFALELSIMTFGLALSILKSYIPQKCFCATVEIDPVPVQITQQQHNTLLFLVSI